MLWPYPGYVDAVGLGTGGEVEGECPNQSLDCAG